MDPAKDESHQCPEQAELKRQLHAQLQNCYMEQARLARVSAREEQLRREYQQLIETFRQEILEKEHLQRQVESLQAIHESDLEHIRNIHRILTEIVRGQAGGDKNGK